MNYKMILERNYKQLLFVFAAFAAMAFASYIYVSAVMKRQAELLGRGETRFYQIVLKDLIRSQEDALVHAAASLKMAMDKGASPEELRNILKKWTELFRGQDDIKDYFVSIYGYLDGNYLDETHWVSGEFYSAKTARWFRGAIAEDGIFHSKPYFDPRTNKTVTAISTVIYGDNGKSYGVLALDYLLMPVITRLHSSKSVQNSYSLLTDDEFNLLMFPENKYIGKRIDTIPGYESIVKKLNLPGDEILVEGINGADEKMIGFFSALDNGWHLGLITPLRYYYSGVFQMISVIAILAFTLACVLCAILLRLSAAKQFSMESGHTQIVHESLSDSVPMRNIADQESEMPQKQKYTGQLKVPGAKILVVDDMETNVVVARGLLAPYKAFVKVCMSGKEAIEAAKLEQFDLVLLDHMMPEMDGMETVKALRSLGGWAKKVPVVALTANAMAGMREKFLENGFDDYLPKPIEIAKLDEIMEKWFGKNGDFVPQSAGKLPEIEGIDTELGLRRIGGDVSAYFEVLRIYQRDAASHLKKIGELAITDIDGFVFSAHGLKSASANIGAVSLAEEAAFLEAAGQNRDMSVISAHVGRFVEMIEKITNNINEALGAYISEDTGENYTVDQWELFMMKEALAALDIGLIDDTLKKLSRVRHKRSVSDAISRISDYVLVADFKEASDVIDNLMKDEENERNAATA